MIGEPSSAQGGRPADRGLHASEVAQEWEDVAERNVRGGMKDLGIPGQERVRPDYDGDGRWRAFDPNRPPVFAYALAPLVTCHWS